jgi:hypothetical protein
LVALQAHRFIDKIIGQSSPMSEITLAPRRRPLWRLFIMPVLLLIAAAAWSAFWFYAASQVDVKADAWRAQEAKSGRVYDCAGRSVAGFPFRLEVRCDGASVSLTVADRGAGRHAGAGHGQARRNPGGRAGLRSETADRGIHRAGDDFRSRRLALDAGELEHGPRERGGTAGGSAARLDRVRRPAIDRINGSVQTPLARAKHIELHGRLAEGSPLDHPVIETVLQIEGGSVQEVHPLLAQPFDADVRTMLSGLKDLAPKPWPQRFREIQAAGGHVEIVQSRIAQGDLVAVAAGTLGLTAAGISRRRVADDGGRHREGDSGARPRKNAR